MHRKRERRARRLLGAAGLLCLGAVLATAGHARAALCGDANGDGFVTAADALATLKLAVRSVYDRRADVAPSGGNARVTAADALEVLKASVTTRTPRCVGPGQSRVVVSTAPYDFYSPGGLAVVNVATRAVTFRAAALGGDAVVRTPDDTTVVVNRKNFNSLQWLDASAPLLPTRKECSVSDGFDSNPQDVVLAGPDKGYVTAYAGKNLLVVDPAVLFDPASDPACTRLVKSRIDLSSFDPDGIPEMDQMLLVGTDLFVALQRLDPALQPRAGTNGLVVVLDTRTDTVKGTIPLGFANPFAETKGLPWDEFRRVFYAGGPGKTATNLDDGGLEAIDPATMQSAGVMLTGADLHADLYDFVVVGTRRAFAIVADRDANSVVDIDLRKRSIRKVLLSSTSLITDLEMTEAGELWVAYRGETASDPPGLRVFRVADDAETTATPIALGQAPFTLDFLP